VDGDPIETDVVAYRRTSASSTNNLSQESASGSIAAEGFFRVLECAATDTTASAKAGWAPRTYSL
jgi:hypothetical protein